MKREAREKSRVFDRKSSPLASRQNAVVAKNSDQPILALSLSSDQQSIADLTVLADEQIRRAFENVAGVGEVRIAGGLQREVRVNLDPDRLRSVGVSVPEVMRAHQSPDMEVPAGRIESGPSE